MPRTPLAGYYYPAPSQAPTTAADMMQALLDVDKETTLTAVDAADRDARFGDAKVGTLVASGASGALWLKTASGWLDLYTDTGEVTTGFSTPDDWSIGSWCFARQVGHSVEIAAELIYDGTDDIVGGTGSGSAVPGNIVDTDVLYTPPAFSSLIGTKYRPFYWESTKSGGGGLFYGSGRFVIRDMHPAGIITNGEFLRLSLTFLN